MRHCFNDLTTQRYNINRQKANICPTFFNCICTTKNQVSDTNCHWASMAKSYDVHKFQSFMRLSTV